MPWVFAAGELRDADRQYPVNLRQDACQQEIVVSQQGEQAGGNRYVNGNVKN